MKPNPAEQSITIKVLAQTEPEPVRARIIIIAPAQTDQLKSMFPGITEKKKGNAYEYINRNAERGC